MLYTVAYYIDASHTTPLERPTFLQKTNMEHAKSLNLFLLQECAKDFLYVPNMCNTLFRENIFPT